MNEVHVSRILTPNGFIGYEYKNISVSRELAAIYIDSFPSFGWELDDYSYNNYFHRASLIFKRDRKMKNKVEINKLQRQFEDGLVSISSLENNKGTRASVTAFVVGIIGAALVTGATFAYLSGFFILAMVLAVPGLAGLVLPYFVFKNIYHKRIVQVATEVDREYDGLYVACEKAQALLA